MCDLKEVGIDDLPEEVLLEVERLLPPAALKAATLVEKSWRAVGENPTLWEKFTVTVFSKEDIRNLSIKRLRRIQEISINTHFWDAEDWEAFFRAVMGLFRLKKIDRIRLNMDETFVDPSLFARSLAKLEVVDVSGCNQEHIQALFAEMSNSTQIKKLRLTACRLTQLDPGLFGKVLSRLEDLELTANDTTKYQMEALFTEILNKSSMKILVLREDSCRYLESGLFAKVLSKIEEFRLFLHVPDLHLEALFNELSLGNYHLKKLEMRGDFFEIEPALFAHVLSRLEELSLAHIAHIDFLDEQLQALFTDMSQQTQMKTLRFYDLDLSEVEAGLFGRVMARLEEVNLRANEITDEQIVAFFTEVSLNSQLKTLYISSADISSVNPEIFAKAVTQLEAFNLEDTSITSDQLISLFAEMSQTMLIKKIQFYQTRINNWNDLTSVNPQDFAKSLVRLEEVSLLGCIITYDQAMALFREMLVNTQLKKLELEADLSTVEADVMATALIKVKEVDLGGSTLSTEQIETIFKYVLESEKILKKLDLGGVADQVDQMDQEIVRKVQDKLKGELLI